MRVMVLVKATNDSEKNGFNPDDPWTQEMMAAMDRFNDELVRAGVLMDAGGLQPTSKARRVSLGRANCTVTDGPFKPAREQVAGFWIWHVKDMDEAVAWVKRCPPPMRGPSEIEIRPFYELGNPIRDD